MAMTYASWLTTVANYAVVPETDPNFLQAAPSFIAYAEGRLYRDLDLLATVVSDSVVLGADTRTFTLPTPTQGAYDIIDEIKLFEDGNRTPIDPVSQSVVDTLWGASSSNGNTAQRPTMFAVTTDSLVTVGPVSGAPVTLEILGRVKPEPLSASNTETYLTQMFPDLFLIASMIQVAGWQKNFGAGADDQAAGGSWESQYQKLLVAADQTSARENFAGASWTSRRVEPTAIPQRG